MTMPKQIVIDKNTLVAFAGRRFGELCSFARQHVLLLPDTLLYECTTTTRQSPTTLVDKCERLIKEGAHYCSMSTHFIQWEARHCMPYEKTLTDAEDTDRIRSGTVSVKNFLASGVAWQLHDQRMRRAKRLFVQFSDSLKAKLDSRVDDVGRQVRELPSARRERLAEWLGQVDPMDIHAMAVESFPSGWIRVKGEFCQSPAWMTWQHLRLLMVFVYEYWYIRQTGSPPDRWAEWAEHDLQDAEYILLLSRADAILTEDKKLIELARAAFPEREVFSSLEEVPESYRCD
jgi:hypothetical protein